MNPEQLPLEPLIAPPPISMWPLAPIWWVLLAFIILVILLIIGSRLKKKYRTTSSKVPQKDFDARRQAALTELAEMVKPYDQAAGTWLQQLNNLLKRVCNVRYPTENSKILMGQAWLNYLDSKYPKAQLKRYNFLIEGEYQDDYFMDKTTIDALYSSLEEWITHHV